MMWNLIFLASCPFTVAGLAGTLIEAFSTTRSTLNLILFVAVFTVGYGVSIFAEVKDRQLLEERYARLDKQCTQLASELETYAIMTDEKLMEAIKSAEKETEEVPLEKHVVQRVISS